MYSTSNSNHQYNPEVPLYRQAISNITTEIVTTKNNAQTVKKVRDMFYDLLVNCVPPDVIIRWIIIDLMEYLGQEQKVMVISIAADIDSLLK